MNAVAQAYIDEYSEIPNTDEARDRYNAFRYGYEAGRKVGYNAAITEAVNKIEELYA